MLRDNPATRQVVRIPIGYANVFLIRGKRHVLVDTGIPGSEHKVVARLTRKGIDPAAISLIVVTHGHFDHFGSVDRLRDMLHVPVAIHRHDADSLRQGVNQRVVPRTTQARLLLLLLKGRVPGFVPFEPDIILDDRMSLAEYGVAGQVIATPGHTPGSVSICTEGGECLVGDLLMGGKPNYPMFADDLEEVKRSIEKVMALGPRLIYPGHGRPFDASLVARLLR